VYVALEHYDLAPVRLRLITNETNGIFRLDVADGRKLVVRVGLGGEIAHSPGQVEAETGWLAALAADTDLIVPEPVPARDGRRFVRVEVDGVPDPRNVVVFTWLAGTVLDEHLGEEVMPAYGALAARLHEHGRGHRPAAPEEIARYDEVIPFDEPMVLFDAPASLLPPSRRRVFGAAVERVEEGIAALRASSGPMRILHGDLHPWNVMVSRRGLAPFDFEDLMWGWPVQDVATTLWYLVRRPEYRAWKARFRQGYEAVAPWPAGSDEDLATFLIGRYVVLGNDLVLTPEWRAEAERLLPMYEAHVERLLDGRPIST
jgi:Ser/Thr protein kinase RdoA (MazF antagonist)